MWGFIHVWCLVLLSCSWHHQWAKQMLDRFLCLSNNTYFIAMYSALKLFSPLSALWPVWRRWLCCHTGLESVSTPACPFICSNARPSPLLILPCMDSITHSYSLTERGLLTECCWANGMTVLVIWKLPAVCVFHYWQWCFRRIYGSGKSLVNLFLLFRCHLCANEAIESALYAVAYTFVGSGVLNRHFLVVMLMLQNPGE